MKNEESAIILPDNIYSLDLIYMYMYFCINIILGSWLDLLITN